MRIHLTNVHKSRICHARHCIVWRDVEIGEPLASKTLTVEELKEFGMVGLYRTSNIPMRLPDMAFRNDMPMFIEGLK